MLGADRENFHDWYCWQPTAAAPFRFFSQLTMSKLSWHQTILASTAVRRIPYLLCQPSAGAGYHVSIFHTHTVRSKVACCRESTPRKKAGMPQCEEVFCGYPRLCTPLVPHAIRCRFCRTERTQKAIIRPKYSHSKVFEDVYFKVSLLLYHSTRPKNQFSQVLLVPRYTCMPSYSREIRRG